MQYSLFNAVSWRDGYNIIHITYLLTYYYEHIALYLQTHNYRIHTNLDELSFFTVFALPNASRIGFASSNCCSSSPYIQHTSLLL